jgi:cytochrome b6-f complex iron-sulfur subunit
MPNNNTEQSENNPSEIKLKQPVSTRREFMKYTGVLVGGIAISSLLPAAAQVQIRTQDNPNSKGMVDLGPVSAFKAKGVTDRTKDMNTYISHTASGVIALVAICTHEGCKPNYDSSGKDFSCRCHGAGFAEDGAPTARPARTPLARFALSVKGSRLMMDTSKYILRSSVQATDFLKV